MIRLKDTKHPTTSSFLSSAIRVAEYYGFSHLDDMDRQKQPPRDQKKRSAKNDIDVLFARKDERPLPSIARKLLQCMKVPAPEQVQDALLAWRIGKESASNPYTSLELHIVGTSSAIAEALLIVVANAIIQESGVSQKVLSINNIGSHESSNRFVRDIGVYLRKHIETISPTLRPRIVDDPLGTLVQLIERGHPAISRAPQAMEYLTEEERRRFWELLEYLEVFGLPYELNGQVLGSRDCWAHSLYEISVVDEETGARIAVAFGGRYDPVTSRVHGRHMPAVMISINCEVRGGTRPKRATPGMPSIYYAHLGPEARRRSLGLLEMLRSAGIPIHQGLHFDRIGEQMMAARNLAVPFIVIMGHKEAMEGTVLVREVATNSQDAVPLPELPNYLKRKRVGSWSGSKV